jgi:hypothetical protein
VLVLVEIAVSDCVGILLGFCVRDGITSGVTTGMVITFEGVIVTVFLFWVVVVALMVG